MDATGVGDECSRSAVELTRARRLLNATPYQHSAWSPLLTRLEYTCFDTDRNILSSCPQ